MRRQLTEKRSQAGTLTKKAQPLAAFFRLCQSPSVYFIRRLSRATPLKFQNQRLQLRRVSSISLTKGRCRSTCGMIRFSRLTFESIGDMKHIRQIPKYYPVWYASVLMLFLTLQLPLYSVNSRYFQCYLIYFVCEGLRTAAGGSTQPHAQQPTVISLSCYVAIRL